MIWCGILNEAVKWAYLAYMSNKSYAAYELDGYWSKQVSIHEAVERILKDSHELTKLILYPCSVAIGYNATALQYSDRVPYVRLK